MCKRDEDQEALAAMTDGIIMAQRVWASARRPYVYKVHF